MAVVKILLGIVLLLAGLWLLLPLNLGPFSGMGWKPFLVVLAGTIPVLLALMGILILWMEAEESKSKPIAPATFIEDTMPEIKRGRGRPSKQK